MDRTTFLSNFLNHFAWPWIHRNLIWQFARREVLGRYRGSVLGVGWSVIVYAILGIIMSGLRPLFLRGRWEVHCLFSGIATSVLVLAEYLMISLRREPLRFEFNPEIWGRILGAGLVALVLSPFVFMSLGYLSRLMKHQHYRPEREGLSQ
jgi:hypothetical protein